MRRFELYRYDLPRDHIGGADAPDKLRAEGIIFTDGTVVLRWLDGKIFQSTSVWHSYEAFLLVHGHPEFGSLIKFLDRTDGESEDDKKTKLP